MSWRFSPCSPCCDECTSGTTQICVTVLNTCGLGQPQTGISVEASGPDSLTASGTTGGTGLVCLPITRAGSWHVIAHGPCGDVSTDITVACGESPNITLNVPGYNVTIHVDKACIEDSEIFSGVNYWLEPVQTGPPIGTASLPITYCLAPGNYVWHFIGSGCVGDFDHPFTVGCASQTLNLTAPGKEFSYSGHVTGCSNPLAGANVVVAGTAGSWSGVTDSNGDFTATGLQAFCEFQVTISKDRFVTTTFPTVGGPNFTMPCSDVTDISFGLSPASGYTCWGCCTIPLTDPLTVSDSQGTHALHLSAGQWFSPCIVKTGVTGYSTVIGAATCDGTTGPIDVAYFYTVSCDAGTKKWTIIRSMPTCSAPGPTPAPMASFCHADGFPRANFGTTVISGESVIVDSPFGSCGPLSLDFNFSFGFADTATLNG